MDDIKYLENGQKVFFVQQLDGGILVSTVIEVNDFDGYREISGELKIVQRVFDNPPTEKFAAEIKTLAAEVESLKVAKRQISRDIAAIEKDNKARLETYKRFDALRLLDDYIAGKITHYVTIDYDEPRIIEFSDAHCNYDKKALKLLTLFGASNGDLSWRLNYYRDGSGGSNEVYPATSYEEALERAKAHLISRAEATKENPRKGIIESAASLGLQLDEAYIAKYREQENARNQRLVEEMKQKLRELESAK